MARSFGTSDAYSTHLRELGHDAVELVVNALPLQRRWAVEHGRASVSRRLAAVPTRLGNAVRARFLHEVAAAQLDELDPDVVYVQDLWFFARGELDALRAAGRLVVGQIASEPPGLELLRGYDLITTSFPHYVERFRTQGLDSEYFKIGFYERVLERLSQPASGPAVSFIGGLNPTIHGRRVALLERLVEQLPVEIWGWGAEALPPGSPILKSYRGEAWGLDMYEVLSGSRITLDRHIDAAEGYANNMRLFEATGVGTLLMTEAAPNLADLFEPGKEVVAYESEDDLVAKIRHYLDHEDERAVIAAGGQRRALTEHTYRRRMAELVEILAPRFEAGR